MWRQQNHHWITKFEKFQREPKFRCSCNSTWCISNSESHEPEAIILKNRAILEYQKRNNIPVLPKIQGIGPICPSCESIKINQDSKALSQIIYKFAYSELKTIIGICEKFMESKYKDIPLDWANPVERATSEAEKLLVHQAENPVSHTTRKRIIAFIKKNPEYIPCELIMGAELYFNKYIYGQYIFWKFLKKFENILKIYNNIIKQDKLIKYKKILVLDRIK